MSLPVTDLISGIFKPASNLVDELHTSDDEKLAAHIKMMEVQSAALQAALAHDRDIMATRARMLEAETASEHWLTANWRPVAMLAMVAMVGAYWFGLVDPADRIGERAVEQVLSIVQVGLGIYAAGRSAEKVAKTVRIKRE